MKTIKEISVGENVLKLVETADGYVVIRNNIVNPPTKTLNVALYVFDEALKVLEQPKENNQ